VPVSRISIVVKHASLLLIHYISSKSFRENLSVGRKLSSSKCHWSVWSPYSNGRDIASSTPSFYWFLEVARFALIG